MEGGDASESLGPLPGELSRNQRRQVARARRRAEAMTAEAARVAEEAARAVDAVDAFERGAVALARDAESNAHSALAIPHGSTLGNRRGGGLGRRGGRGSGTGRGRGEGRPIRRVEPSLLPDHGNGSGSPLSRVADSASISGRGLQLARGMSVRGRLGATQQTTAYFHGRRVAQRTHAMASGAVHVVDGAQSAPDMIAVINDARRVSAGRVGGLTATLLRMLLSALQLAGTGYLPSRNRLQVLSQCRGGCGDVEAIDSLLASAVRILHEDGDGAPSSGDTAAAGFLVQQALASHGCKGQFSAVVHRAPPSAHPVAAPPAPVPAPRPSNTPTAPRAKAVADPRARRRPLLRQAPPPPKRFRRTASRDGDPPSTATVTTFARPPLHGPQVLPRASSAGAPSRTRSVPVFPVLSASSLPVPPRFRFPVRAERHVQLSAMDLASLEEGMEMSKHMRDGRLLWFLYWARSSGVIGGLRVLSALDGEDVKDASTDDVLIVNRAACVLLDRLVFSGGTVVMPIYSRRG